MAWLGCPVVAAHPSRDTAWPVTSRMSGNDEFVGCRNDWTLVSIDEGLLCIERISYVVHSRSPPPCRSATDAAQQQLHFLKYHCTLLLLVLRTSTGIVGASLQVQVCSATAPCLINNNHITT